MVEPSHRDSPPQINMNSTQKLAINNGLHQRSKKNRKTFSLQHFHCPKEKWGSQTSDQFEGLESISSYPSFQDGKFSNSKGLDTGRGLDDKTRFERSLSFSSPDSRSSEIPCLPLGWQMLCLLCSSLWAESCPTCVYKNHKTDSCSYSTESGDSLCYVFRRHPDFWEDQDRLPSKGKERNDTVTRVGFHNKYKESNPRAHSADRVSGPNSGLNPDERPKVLDLVESCQAILIMTSLTARSLASLQGKMSSCLHAVLPAPTFYRAIQADIHQAIGKTNNFSKKTDFVVRDQIRNTVVDSQCTPVEWASSSLASPISDHINRCCQKGGWGASCNKHKTQGWWTQEEASLHINILELKAALFALKSFAKVYQMTNAHVRLKIDNTPAQAYINHRGGGGGTKSVGLCNQAQELWKWYLLHQTIVSAEHLPGIHNRDAEQVSRIFNDRTELMISPHLLREALSLLAVNPSIHLFASRLNKQFPIFFSWKPDPDAWKIDAFSFPWIQKGPYAFPPFCLWEKF